MVEQAHDDVSVPVVDRPVVGALVARADTPRRWAIGDPADAQRPSDRRAWGDDRLVACDVTAGDHRHGGHGGPIGHGRVVRPHPQGDPGPGLGVQDDRVRTPPVGGRRQHLQ